MAYRLKSTGEKIPPSKLHSRHQKFLKEESELRMSLLEIRIDGTFFMINQEVYRKFHE